jgi:Adenylylsulphate kinase
MSPAPASSTFSSLWRPASPLGTEREPRRHPRIWITGPPGASTSAIGRLLDRRLAEAGWPTDLLEGEELRTAVKQELGSGAGSQNVQVRGTAWIAGRSARDGVLCVATLAVPARRSRKAARVESDRILLVYVTPPPWMGQSSGDAAADGAPSLESGSELERACAEAAVESIVSRILERNWLSTDPGQTNVSDPTTTS